MKSRARRFLEGLSSDELQFIAEFLGSCVIESHTGGARNRAELAEGIASFERGRANRTRILSADQEHKMIVLLEYLCTLEVQELQMHASAGGSSVN